MDDKKKSRRHQRRLQKVIEVLKFSVTVISLLLKLLDIVKWFALK